MRVNRVAAAGVALAACAALARLTRYEIAEHSMEPALRHGDWVIAVRRPRRLRRGDVVVLEHPRRPGFEMVKRVAALEGELAPDLGIPVPRGAVWVLGDHLASGSVDSRQLGPIARDAVRAVVVARYHPAPPRWIRRWGRTLRRDQLTTDR
jgi:signal peptidase I